MTKVTSPRFLVRVTLSDGSVINGGGFQRRDTARTLARGWVSEATFRSREANGALPVITAIVTFAGEVVERFATPSGKVLRFEP